MNNRDYKRILIIKPSSFGDVIHTLPVLNGLRQRFGDAHISWLVSTACSELLKGHPALDEIIPFDRKHYGRIGRSWRATLDFIRFVRELRERKFDLVLDLQGLFRSGFLTWASGASKRMGFAATRECAGIFYTDRVVLPDKDMHAVDRNYLFGKLLGFDDVPIAFDLPIQPQARDVVARKLADGGVKTNEPYALIAPGTRWETKRWPTEFFAQVADAIQSEHGLAVVLVGAPDEVDVAKRVQQLAVEPVVNLAGQTSLPEMIAMVADAAIVVMNDTGPMHLAMALNKPLVAIYGPTNPSWTGPYRKCDSAIWLNVECSPCRYKRLSQCPFGQCCMQQLSPDRVMERVAKVLAEVG